MTRTMTTLLACVLFVVANPAAAGPEEKDKPAAEKTREVKARNLTLRIPVNWKQQRPSNSMRMAQFELPPAKGDNDPGELVFYYFPRGAGGVRANLERWINQFEAKDRKVKLTKGKATQGTYYLAEVTGAYNKPVGPPRLQRSKRTPGSKMLAVYIEAKGEVYYVKLTGPKNTITAAAKSFRGSFGASAKTEEKFEL